MFGGLKKTVVAVAVAASALGLNIASVPAQAETSTSLVDRFSAYPTSAEWADSTTHGFWRAVFNGYGRIGIARSGSKVLSLRPKAAADPNKTHAALVVSKREFGDQNMRLRMKTVKQLRDGNPNPWEVAWSIWNYKDNTHFYYLILKPNGWELGKADPAYPGAQRFLATGGKKFAVGKWHNVRVKQVGNRMTVWANGQRLTTFTDRENPYRRGAVGVYNEDAKTFFDDVSVTAL